MMARILVVAVAACTAAPPPPPTYPPVRQYISNPPPPPSRLTADIRYNPECVPTFQADPARYQAQPAAAAAADAHTRALFQYLNAATDRRDIVGATVAAIRQARNALILDAYNPDLTLQLALAYDRAFRKGCALALLRRIAALAEDPRFQARTKLVLDIVTDSPSFFAGYRREAMAALGLI